MANVDLIILTVIAGVIALAAAIFRLSRKQKDNV
jgi:hypothetical protein